LKPHAFKTPNKEKERYDIVAIRKKLKLGFDEKLWGKQRSEGYQEIRVAFVEPWTGKIIARQKKHATRKKENVEAKRKRDQE